MPHGLGSGADFGHQFESQPEPESQGNLKRLEDLLAQEEMDNLGPEADADEATAEAPEDNAEDVALEPISVEELQSLILGAGGSQPMYSAREYYMAPEQLVVLVHHEIIDRDEARNYLRSQGIELFG